MTQYFHGNDATYYANSQRMLWLVDWSDVKIGVAGTNSVTSTQPHPEVEIVCIAAVWILLREHLTSVQPNGQP